MGTYPSSTCRQSIAAWPLMTLTDFQAKSGGTGMHKHAFCICPSFPAASPAARHGNCTAVSLCFFFFFLGKKKSSFSEVIKQDFLTSWAHAVSQELWHHSAMGRAGSSSVELLLPLGRAWSQLSISWSRSPNWALCSHAWAKQLCCLYSIQSQIS